jgi:hypothetical protein
MIGIFFFTVLGLWLWVCLALARALMRRLGRRPWRYFVGLAAFIVLLVAPVADEIAGGMQFRALCEREAVLTIDAEKVRGRTLKRFGVKLPAVDAVVDIERWRESFVDAISGEELISFVWLRVSGGRFVRALHISEGNEPLLIHPSTCDPGRSVRWEKVYGFVLINE